MPSQGLQWQWAGELGRDGRVCDSHLVELKTLVAFGLWRPLVFFSSWNRITPGKINMEPDNHWVVEENSLPKVNFQVPC